MRYLIAGNTALLSTRTFQVITNNTLCIEAVGISQIATGTTVNIMREGKETKHFSLTDRKASIPLSSLHGEGDYAVTFAWQEVDAGTGEKEYHEAYGNSFKICKVGNELGVIPSYTHTTTDIDMMWNGVVQLMEILIPFIEQYKYGNDAV